MILWTLLIGGRPQDAADLGGADSARPAPGQDAPGQPTDSDGDGLTISQGADLGTDPLVTDSDGDGLSDADEVQAGTDPLKADTDDDGLTDSEEADLGTDLVVTGAFDGDLTVDDSFFTSGTTTPADIALNRQYPATAVVWDDARRVPFARLGASGSRPAPSP